MAESRLKPIVIDDLTGGRNGADDPFALPMNQCVEALNVDHFAGRLARKRGGATAVTETGGTAFSSGIQTLIRHVPGADETAAELWGVDGAGTPIVKRMTGGTSFANVTLDDAIATKPQDVQGVSFNGKLYLPYDSTVDRLHVYDPSLASPRVRRVSFATPAAPTAVNTGGGTYAATPRYYRVRWIQVAGSILVRRSEPGPSVAFTPSGSGSGVDVTRPTAPGEGETHWEVEVSLDNSNWTVWLGTLPAGGDSAAFAIASTTPTDINATTLYATWPLSASAGQHARFPSVKYLLTDGNRLLGAGAWETTGADSGGKNSRVWFTPVLGSTDHGDDERVPNTTNQKNWVDLNENDGGGVTSLGGPINGVAFAFKYRQTYRLTPTGDVTVPYLPKRISDAHGSIAHKATVSGRDHVGNPALYFLSPDGPCRITTNAYGTTIVQYLGRDVEDLWATVNKAASSVVAHGIYHADKHQVWWWIATGTSTDPDTKLVFDVLLGKFVEGERVRGGWYKHTGSSAAARCSVLMSNTLGASMSRDLKPYIGRASGTAIWKCDTTDLDDAGTAFQGSVTTRPILTTGDLLRKVGVEESTLVAKAQANTTVSVTINRDFGKETRALPVDLSPVSTETRVVKKVEGSTMGEADVVQLTIGDQAAVANTWTVDAVITPLRPQEWR